MKLRTMGKMFSSFKSIGSMESNRLGSAVECKFQLLTAFVRHRRWVLGKPQVWQHDQSYVRVVNFGHHAKFSFALRADHEIDGEDSTEERCPVDSVSFVFHRFGLSCGEHLECAAPVRITYGAIYRRSWLHFVLHLRHDPFPHLE